MKKLDVKQMENLQAGNPCPETSSGSGWLVYWAWTALWGKVCLKEYVLNQLD